MREGGWRGSVPQKNVSLRGAGVDFQECQERRRGKHKGTKKSVFFFFGESIAGQKAGLQKNTDFFCAFVLAPAPLRLTFFWEEG